MEFLVLPPCSVLLLLYNYVPLFCGYLVIPEFYSQFMFSFWKDLVQSYTLQGFGYETILSSSVLSLMWCCQFYVSQ